MGRENRGWTRMDADTALDQRRWWGNCRLLADTVREGRLNHGWTRMDTDTGKMGTRGMTMDEGEWIEGT
jgi:hypothetical protein